MDVIQVLNGALTAEQYQQLSEEIRQVIVDNTNATRRLIQDYGATFSHLQALSAPELLEFINESLYVERLINEAHIPFADLLALKPSLRTEFIDNSVYVTRLINEAHIAFEQLSSLSVQQLRTVIANPESEASQAILSPPSHSRSQMF